MTLGTDELSRYARHIVLKEIGGRGQARLRDASVVIIGAGGIGSPAIQYLAAAGVGRLVLIDDDRVDASNLQRQTIYATGDVGRDKVEAAAVWIAGANPHVSIDPHAIRFTPANATALLANADVVIDGSDSFATRLAVADATQQAHIPLVSAAVGQFDGQLAVYRGWEADKPCYRCLVGNPPARDEGSCAEDGVLGPVTGILGSMAALEAIRAIVPFGADPAGQLLIADFMSFRFRTIALPKDPDCAGCRAR